MPSAPPLRGATAALPLPTRRRRAAERALAKIWRDDATAAARGSQRGGTQQSVAANEKSLIPSPSVGYQHYKQQQ